MTFLVKLHTYSYLLLIVTQILQSDDFFGTAGQQSTAVHLQMQHAGDLQ